MDAGSAVEGNWYDLAVPVILLLIMICMGMELVLADFKRVIEMAWSSCLRTSSA
ncbi:MAG: hypothetical protein JRE70_18485 [Deltaproteobacteria bacterium]|nr:hypothetical protein [Deltaproteobacteria bacterium]